MVHTTIGTYADRNVETLLNLASWICEVHPHCVLSQLVLAHSSVGFQSVITILVRHFHLLAVMNNVTMNILVCCFGCMYVYILLGICLGLKLKDHIICTFLS